MTLELPPDIAGLHKYFEPARIPSLSVAQNLPPVSEHKPVLAAFPVVRLISYTACGASMAAMAAGLLLYPVWSAAHVVCGLGMIGLCFAGPAAIWHWEWA